MPLDKPLALITKEDLEQLISDKVLEDKTIEYRRQYSLDNDKAKYEFRKDISAFANTLGGNLILGIDQDDGYPVCLCGQKIDDVDHFKRQIIQTLENKISPRIPNPEIHALEISENTYAIIIRIGRSFVKPHQIEANDKDFQFWGRNSDGNYRIPVDELRQIILRSDTAADNVRRFRTELITSIFADEMPVPIRTGPRILLNMIPLNAFDAECRYDLSPITGSAWFDLIRIMDGVVASPHNTRYNLDGYVGYATYQDGEPNDSYVQVYRNGIIEYLDAYQLSAYPNSFCSEKFWCTTTEEFIISAIKMGLSIQAKLDVQCPIVVMLSIIDGQDVKIYPQTLQRRCFGRYIISIPESIVESYDADISSIVRPIFDVIWNAGGFAKCLHFNNAGKYSKLPNH